MVREAMYFAIFWLAALLGMLFFIFGGTGLADAAVGAAMVSLGLALWNERSRRHK